MFPSIGLLCTQVVLRVSGILGLLLSMEDSDRDMIVPTAPWPMMRAHHDKNAIDDRFRFSGLDGDLSCRPAAGCCAMCWLWSGYSCLCSFIWIMHDRSRSHLPRRKLRRCMIHSPLSFFLCILRLLRVSLSFSRRRFIKIARQVYDLLGNRIHNYLTNRGRRGFDDGTIGSCTRRHVVCF